MMRLKLVRLWRCRLHLWKLAPGGKHADLLAGSKMRKPLVETALATGSRRCKAILCPQARALLLQGVGANRIAVELCDGARWNQVCALRRSYRK